MRAIIIGAGRGRRLMPTTRDRPKCFAEVRGRRILDRTVAALAEAGITDIRFIGGYQIDKVQREYEQFSFSRNTEWESNNILESLMCARDLMDEPFVCSYSDTLFTGGVVSRLLENPADITLAVDTQWLDRYRHRSEHPPDDAEKVIVENGLVTRVHRDIETSRAHGEYTGVAKFSAAGARLLTRHYAECKASRAGKPFREAAVFEKAYLIHLLQEMIEQGVAISHSDTAGEYMEIDTQQDFELAQTQWSHD